MEVDTEKPVKHQMSKISKPQKSNLVQTGVSKAGH